MMCSVCLNRSAQHGCLLQTDRERKLWPGPHHHHQSADCQTGRYHCALSGLDHREDPHLPTEIINIIQTLVIRV